MRRCCTYVKSTKKAVFDASLVLNMLKNAILMDVYKGKIDIFCPLTLTIHQTTFFRWIFAEKYQNTVKNDDNLPK